MSDYSAVTSLVLVLFHLDEAESVFLGEQPSSVRRSVKASSDP